MPRYQIMSPNGWMGAVIETDDDDNAVQMAKSIYGETEILDLQTSLDDHNKEIILIVVPDEEPS